MKKMLVALLALALLMMAAGAMAETKRVSYCSWNGSAVVENPAAQECIVVESSGSAVTWDSGWYAVSQSVTINGRITVNGKVNLILCDGATLEAKGGIDVAEGNTLNIYGQTGGTGKLNAKGYYSCAGIGGGARQNGGTITIHGGTISATGSSDGAGIGGGFYGDGGTITIYGGNVTAAGKSIGGADLKLCRKNGYKY